MNAQNAGKSLSFSEASAPMMPTSNAPSVGLSIPREPFRYLPAEAVREALALPPAPAERLAIEAGCLNRYHLVGDRMPIYDYRCQECGKVSELLVRSLDDSSITCPECGSTNLTRLVAASAMVVMGPGAQGTTCCGRAERCEAPPCSTGDVCRRR